MCGESSSKWCRSRRFFFVTAARHERHYVVVKHRLAENTEIR
jgi:hypothetical protein